MARKWRDAVLDAVTRQARGEPGEVVARQTLIADELDRVMRETGSQGLTPHQTLSRVLQGLRDEGLIEFMREGSDRLVHAPVDVELRDLSDDDIDAAIQRRLLRIGQVDTGEAICEARRRRGQDRVRALTLKGYGQRCALCDIDERPLLVASHIVPWAVAPDARGDLANVICRCQYPLFECGYWSLSDELTIVHRTRIRSAMIRSLLAPDVAYRRPVAYPPDAEFGRWHRERHSLAVNP